MRHNGFLGGLVLGIVLAKVASNHGVAAGHGPGHRRRLSADDPRRQWIREFHRSLHEADDAEAGGTSAGTTGDAASAAKPATAG
jgi:hypothetical protein